VNVLLTGYTGNLGPAIAEALSDYHVCALVRDVARAPVVRRVELVEGSLEEIPGAVAHDVEVIVHAAASTAFRAPIDELRRVNVAGTARMLAFACRCPRLQRFLHISTVCVAGKRGGLIEEASLTERPNFVNGYEQSKWEAEQLVLAAELPVEIVRVAIVAGSECDGSVRRPGALHHALRWLQRGLIPMMPGTPETPVDLVSNEFVADVIAALLREPLRAGRIVHASAGDFAPTLRELIDHFAALFTSEHRGWATGAIVPPDIVDAETYALFEHSVAQSGDALFRRVCDDAQSFLPMLLHPRTCATSVAATRHSVDWKILCERVLAWLIATDWGRRSPHPAYADA
jgi:nucleoside-diphosphate-sugar epimerase